MGDIFRTRKIEATKRGRHGSHSLFSDPIPLAVTKDLFPCPETSCQPHCFHCACAASAQGMQEKLLAGEATTKDVWIFWNENAKHNGTEDLGHPGSEVPYADRLGCAIAPAFITWRANGIDFVGTTEGHK